MLQGEKRIAGSLKSSSNGRKNILSLSFCSFYLELNFFGEKYKKLMNKTQVESPLSPHNSSAPASLSQGVAKALQGLHLEEQEGLLIEEVIQSF